MSQKISNMQKALEGWGTVPDWVAALATACDAEGLRHTAGRLGISPALVSLVIRRAHHGGYGFAEARVRRDIMTPQLSCPVLGPISARQCEEEQSRPFTSVNPLAVAVYRACHGGCAHCSGKSAGPE